MHRRPLQTLLARYGSSPLFTGAERSSWERLVDFVEREPKCFERSTREGHITGSAWLLNHERSAFLLTHHKKLGLWLQCGGHADGDPDVLQVALREAAEESGIAGIEPVTKEIFDVDVHRIPANEKDPEHFHFDVRFLLVAPPGARFVVSDESHALAWVTLEEVGSYDSDGSVRRMAEKSQLLWKTLRPSEESSTQSP